MGRHHLCKPIAFKEDILTVNQSVRHKALKNQLSDLVINTGVALDDQNVILFLSESGEKVSDRVLRKDLTFEILYDGFRLLLQAAQLPPHEHSPRRFERTIWIIANPTAAIIITVKIISQIFIFPHINKYIVQTPHAMYFPMMLL